MSTSSIGVIENSDLSYIYKDYTPAIKNLYEIFILSEEDTISNLLKYHATSVSFNGEKLNLIRHEGTKNFAFSNSPYERTDTLTITWRETSDWSVKKFHEDWISLFYDRSKDQYISTEYGTSLEGNQRTKTFKITLPHLQKSESYDQLYFYGVLPCETGGLDLAWSSSPSIVTHTINYYVKYWDYGESFGNIIARSKSNSLTSSNDIIRALSSTV